MLPPFYQDTIFFFIPHYGNNDNPCYNDTLRKERELLLLPSSTVLLFEKLVTRKKLIFTEEIVFVDLFFEVGKPSAKISTENENSGFLQKRGNWKHW